MAIIILLIITNWVHSGHVPGPCEGTESRGKDGGSVVGDWEYWCDAMMYCV